MAVGDEIYLRGDSNREGSIRLLVGPDTGTLGKPNLRLQALVGGAWVDSELDSAAGLTVGTTAGTVAAGDDSRITGAATAASVTAEASARSTADALLAPLANPTLTGTPAAPSAAAATNTTQIATTAYTRLAVPDVVAGTASATPASGDTVLGLVSGVLKKFASRLVQDTWLGALTGEVARALSAHLADQPLSVRAFNAKGDAIRVTGVSTTASSTTVNATGGAFVAGDVGKVFSIPFGTTGNKVFTSTIASRVSATQITVTVAPTATTSGQIGTYGTDDKAAFAAAYAALPATGGTIFVPAGKYLMSFAGADAVSNLISAVAITKPDVFIIGTGDASEICFVGVTTADFNSGGTDNGAGYDTATVFAFTSTSGGGVRDLRITGQHITGTDTALTNLRPRAKGIGITNCQRVNCTGITGKGIPGNLINWAGNTGVEATSTVHCVADHCVAEHCGESAFNHMGGTYKCAISNCIGMYSGYHGLETGCIGLTCTNNVFSFNLRWGITQVGNGGAFTGNVCDANGTALNLGAFNLQYNNGTSSGTKNVIVGNWFRSTGATFGFACNGGCSDWIFSDNYVEAQYTAWINSDNGALGCSGWRLSGNKLYNPNSTGAVLTIGTPCSKFVVSENNIEGGDNGLYITYVMTGTPDYQGAETNDVYCQDFSISDNRISNSSVRSAYIQGYYFTFTSNNCIPLVGATEIGTVGYAYKSQIRGNFLRNVSGTQTLNFSGNERSMSVADNSGGGYDLVGSKSYTPTLIATNSQITTTVTVTGAALGDAATAFHSVSLALVSLDAYVSAANTVTCLFKNSTGGNVTPAAGTLTAYVRRAA